MHTKQSPVPGLADYISLGYIPTGKRIGDEVSATLNYALADFAIAAAAERMGLRANASVLRNRSRVAWRLLFDGSYQGGVFRPKDASGAWPTDFDLLG